MHWYITTGLIFLMWLLPLVIFNKKIAKSNLLAVRVLAAVLFSATWPILIAVALQHIISHFRK